jgi:protein involved in polysaccharide export with SLBB domain
MKKRSKLAAAVASALMGVGLLGGCDTNLNPLDVKSWIDPSELAGRGKKDTLHVKILDKIDPNVEETNREFVTAQPPLPEDLVPGSTDYVVSKNDMLSIEISDLGGPGTQTVKTSRVTESGMISLPFVGQIKAEGLTEYELEQAIVKAYKDAGILQRAQVSVVVPERRGAVYDIQGAVAQPGQYPIVDPDTKLLNAITIARETTSTQLTDVYIIRRTDLNRPKSNNSGGNAPATPGTTTPPTRPGGAEDLRPQSLLPVQSNVQQSAIARNYAPRAATARPRFIESVQPNQPSVQQLPLLLDDSVAIPGTSGGRDENGRYTIIDGKKIYIDTPAAPGATPGTTAAPAPSTPAPASDLAPTPAPTPVPAAAAVPATQPTTPAPMPAAAPSSSNNGFAFRDLSAPDNVRVIHIPLDRLRQGELQYNVVIRPKDIIVIQPLPVGNYYVGGHVGQPGAYSLTQSRVTLKQAIISARMLDQLAIPERTDIIRRIGKDQEVFVRVNLAKIFEGEMPDFYLKPDDQVLVGTNMVAPFLAAIRGAFRFTYGFGFLYDRNFAAEQNNKIGR